MRLGQISRKLGVSQTEIVRYLSGKNLPVEEGSNVKLGEEQVRALYAHFAPSDVVNFAHRDADYVGSPPEKTNQLPSDSVPEEQEPDIPAHESEPVVTSSVDKSSPSTSVGEVPNASTPDQAETIRAPRIELAGLKVIGKIELPQAKKKESAASDDTTKESAVEGLMPEGDSPVILPGNGGSVSNAESETGKAKERPQRREGRRDDKRRSMGNQPREHRTYKNPIAAQREREMEEERQRRKQKAELEKARRTQNYQKRVKHQPPTKAARLIDEQVEQINESMFDSQPTSWFGKFMKWLRS